MAYLEYIPVRPLFHYTNEVGLHGILESRELWLSNLEASNDPRDIHLGIETVAKIAGELKERELSKEEGRILNTLLEGVRRHYKTSRMYTSCFTPDGDNINMWREYGGNGTGFSIGFRPRAITDMHGRIYKVRYIDEKSYDDIYNTISEIIKPIEYYGDTIFNDYEKELDLSTSLITLVNSLKHVSWSYESEVRLTLSSPLEKPNPPIPLSLSGDDREYFWKPHKTRAHNGTEIHYHSLAFGKYRTGSNDHREAIQKIVIGPKSQLAKRDVTEILLDNGYANFEIASSECLFR